MAEDLEVGDAPDRVVDVTIHLDRGVHEPVAARAADVVVLLGLAVEPLEGAASIDATDLPGPARISRLR